MAPPMNRVMNFILFLAMAMAPLLSQAVDIHQVRQMAAKFNVTCMLVFGDSSVDPGNNNRLMTPMKGDFLPYGKDFFEGKPTGRFSNGRLPTDFIADALGFTKAIPAFLDPKLNETELLHGASFASAASGYDDLTANLSNVLTLAKQMEYFKHYKMRVQHLVGVEKANNIIKNAIFLFSMGTNDFLQNYYIEPTRSQQYTLEQYEDFLVSRMVDDIKELRKLGAGRLVVVGVPPLGCLPLVRFLMGEKACVEKYNNFSHSFNSKIQEKLATVEKTIGVKTAYIDVYTVLQDAVNNPKKYGLIETTKGCCGTGTTEYAGTCKGLNTCDDPSKYAFWDAVHPSQKMYQIFALKGIESVNENILS